MTETDFRARLQAMGLTLDERAFAAAWAGAQHLRAEVARLQNWLKTQE